MQLLMAEDDLNRLRDDAGESRIIAAAAQREAEGSMADLLQRGREYERAMAQLREREAELAGEMSDQHAR